jgi:hypothetical protein
VGQMLGKFVMLLVINNIAKAPSQEVGALEISCFEKSSLEI